MTSHFIDYFKRREDAIRSNPKLAEQATFAGLAPVGDSECPFCSIIRDEAPAFKV